MATLKGKSTNKLDAQDVVFKVFERNLKNQQR